MSHHKHQFKILIILLLSITNLFSQETSTTIKVGYYPGYGFVKDLNSVAQRGYGVDLFQRIESNSDYSFEFIEVDTLLPVEALNSGIIDVYGPLIKLPEREDDLLYLNIPIAETHLILTAKTDENLYYNDLNAIDGKTVATYRGNVANEMLVEHLAQEGISVNFIYAEPGTIHEQDADFFLLVSENAISYDSIADDFRVILSIGMKHVYMVTSKDNIGLANTLDNLYYDALKLDGNLYFDTRTKYLGEESRIMRRYLTEKEADLLKGKTFSVGYTENHRPYQFLNSDGDADGIYIDVLNSLAEEYGFSLEYTSYTVGSRGAHEDFDILISHLGTKEYDLQFYEPTNSFYTSSLLLLTHSGTRVRKDTEAILGMMNYLEDNRIFRRYPSAEIHFYNDFFELVDDFKKGEIGNVLFTEAGAEYIERDLSTFEHSVYPTGIDIPSRIFISNELSDAYVPIFNVLFDHIDSEELELIALDQNTRFLPSYTIGMFMGDYWQLIASVVIIIMLIFAGSILYQKNDKRKAVLDLLYHDIETDLLTTSRFKELAHEVVEKANSGEYELISFDIDAFMMINAVYGLEYSTRTLKAIAVSLVKAFENTSTLVSRDPNDTFYILRRTNAGGRIEEIIEHLVSPSIKNILGKQYNLSISVGIYPINDTKQPITTIVNYAQLARIQAKKTHGIAYYTFDAKMKKSYDLQYEIINKMEHAIADKEFHIVYQPKISLNTLTIKGAEALVRWFPRDGDPIFPNDFIPLFESNGFILKLDMYVFSEVCSFIKTYSDSMDIPVISVNLSAYSFENENLLDNLLRITKYHGVSPKSLELELTESAIVNSDELIIKRTQELKKAGFSVSLDDFGTGVSNLGRLSIINVDIIKLDKAFIDHIEDTNNGSIVLQNIIKMIQTLNMEAVAEGVETAEQASWLRDLGCHIVQGYYFEKPLQQEDFKARLTEKKQYSIEVEANQ